MHIIRKQKGHQFCILSYLHVISWVLGQGSDGAAVVVESVYDLLGAQADHLHMATTANKQPPAQIKTSPTWCYTGFQFTFGH
jgi:hypothetical protein